MTSALGTTGTTITVYNAGTAYIPRYRLVKSATNVAAKTFRHNIACVPVEYMATASGSVPIGVTVDSIAPGAYGTVVIAGTCIVETSDASAAAGEEIIAADTGVVDSITAAQNNTALGITLTAKYTLNVMGVAGGIKGWIADDASAVVTINVLTVQLNLTVGQGIAVGDDTP